jgi:alkanesulfonate monooxygenase SsuD/methylene tetrahydromethanopterin reductase-like flavin-dependent oxidoreductase (luciferase family)
MQAAIRTTWRSASLRSRTPGRIARISVISAGGAEGWSRNHVADLVRRYSQDSEIPHALTDYIRAREGYDYAHHGRVDNRDTQFVPDEIVDRFCVLGDAEEHVAKIREIEAQGMTQFNLYLMHDAIEETLNAYREEIIPRVRAQRTIDHGVFSNARRNSAREKTDIMAIASETQTVTTGSAAELTQASATATEK